VCRKKLLTNGELCQMDNPNGNMLDKIIMEEFKRFYDEADLPNSEINKIKKELRKSQSNYQADIKEEEKQIAACEKSIERFYRDLDIQNDNEIRADIYAKIKEKKQEIENHKRNKLLLEASIKDKRLSEDQLDEVKNALLQLTADDLPLDEKRSIIKKHVKKIVWNGEEARVHWFGEDGTYENPDVNEADGKNPLCVDSE
jgi:site-specific DNA recombinase